MCMMGILMVRCKLCNSVIKKQKKIKTITLFSCDNCMVSFYAPMPTQQQLACRYSSSGLSKRFRGKILNAINTNHEKNKDTFNRYFALLGGARKEHPRGKILDVGCYSGLFLNLFKNDGFACIGIDLNPGLVEYGKKTFGLDLRSGVLADFSFEKEEFNIITCHQVLEHVLDPFGLLSCMINLVVVGGYLEFSVPDSSCNFKITYPEHLFHFYEKTLRYMLSKFSVEIVKIEKKNLGIVVLVRRV